MKKIKLKRWMTPNPAFVALAIAVVVFVCLYSIYLRESFYIQAEHAVEQITRKSAVELDLNVRLAQSYIRQAAYEVSSKIPVPPQQYPIMVLKPLKENSPFSSIEYIRGDGVNIMESGDPFDASNRESFKRGMSGESGVWVDYNSSFSREAVINVYTPLVYGDSVVGVMVGIIGGESGIHPFLDNTLYAAKMVGLLCDQHLNIVYSSIFDDDYGLLFEKRSEEYFPKEVFDIFKKHAVTKNPTAFRFEGHLGTSIATVVQVGMTDWFVVQMVPYHVLSNFTKMVVLRASLAILMVIVLFLIYIYSVHRANIRMRDESEGRHLNIINALTESYGSAIEVNLNTGHFVCYRIHPNFLAAMGEHFDFDHSFERVMALYVKRVVYYEDRHVFERISTLDSLYREFLKRERFEYAYRVIVNNVVHYMQIHFVKPSKDRPEFVMGVKNVDESMSAELDKRKTLNEQRMALVKALDKARKADKAKSSFLFNMSHDIRTPMNAILGYQELAQNYMISKNFSGEEFLLLQHYLKNIRLAGMQLLDLINSVLNMARIESGIEKLEEAPFYPMQISENIVATFEQEAHQKSIMFQVSRNVRPKQILGDRVKLQQVLLNVVSNAVNYTKENGLVRISLRDLPHETPGMCYIEMVVEDTGVGISSEFLPKIFGDFEREHSTLNSGVSGTGLGLSIAKKLVDLMQGTINITSRVGEGTRVVIVTPHRIVEDDVQESLPPKKKTFAGKRVLLADDDSMTCDILSIFLRDAGIEVIVVHDGFECLKQMDLHAAGTYDAILMDIRMPRMDGFETTRRIRKMIERQKAEIPIVAISASVFEEEKKRALAAGMTLHLAKPINSEQLLETLEKIL